MNDPATIPSGDGDRGGVWLDKYLPAHPEPIRPVPAAPQFDISWLRGALFRQRLVIAAALLVALVGGIVVTLLTVPTYKASATVQVSAIGNMIVEGQELLQNYDDLATVLMTQAEVLKSRKLAGEVANNLDERTLGRLLGPDFEKARPEGATEEEWEENKLQLVARILQGGIEVEIPRDNKVMRITYIAEDPLLAATVANAYLDAYVAYDARRNVESNTYARQYLLEQIDKVRGNLQEAEQAANSFARNSGIVTARPAEGEEGITLTTENLSSINASLAAARTSRIAAEQKWQASVSIPALQLPEVQSNGAIQDLLTRRAELNGELTLLRQRYDDQFPNIVDLKSRIGLIDEQIEATARDIKAAIRNQYEIARRQEAALESELATVSEEALAEQDLTSEFAVKEREAGALRDQLQGLLDRYNSLSTAANVQSGTVLPLDRAITPSGPVAPSLTRNLIVSFIIGCALAGSLALFREIVVDQFRRIEDVEDRLGLPLLGHTPAIKVLDLDAGDGELQALMESYASIRAAVNYAIPRDGTAIQLTSSQASEGKSTTAVILAELFARLGRRTLLIDADMRKPSIAKLLDLTSPQYGLTEMLLGHVTFEQAQVAVQDNLTVLPIVGVPPDPVELASSPRFREFIQQCRDEYSIVLIDTSPILGLADAPEIGRLVDSTVFVIEANRTSVNQARTALKRLSNVGAHVMGVVLTKYRALEAGADYSYNYRYYRYGSSD